MKEKYIKLGDKKYLYKIHRINAEVTYLSCPAAEIAQEFLTSDIKKVVKALPKLIQETLKSNK